MATILHAHSVLRISDPSGNVRLAGLFTNTNVSLFLSRCNPVFCCNLLFWLTFVVSREVMQTLVAGGLKRRKKNGRFVKKTIECKPSKRRRIGVGQDEEKVGKTKNVQSGKESSWQEGRRIVELGWIAEQLKNGCDGCKESLCLWDTMTETRQGLGSILYIECRSCGQLCSIKTGKTQRS